MTENSKGMEDVGKSRFKEALKLHMLKRHSFVEVTFRSHYNAYDLFSNATRLSSSLFNGGKIMLYSKPSYIVWKFLICYHMDHSYINRGPCLRGPNEGLVFHRMVRAIRLINSLLNGNN